KKEQVIAQENTSINVSNCYNITADKGRLHYKKYSNGYRDYEQKTDAEDYNYLQIISEYK
ncbi:MAG: hypothetical protein ACJA0X_001964, partial [Cyclobacteriaceae bacterium]